MRSTVLLLCAALAGCAGPRVNYGSFSSTVSLPPRAENAAILMTTKDWDVPYKELGVISATGRSRRTTFDELNDALRQKAREVGGDAVIRIACGTEASNVMVPSNYGHGSFGGTIHRPTCQGVVVVRSPQAPPNSEDRRKSQ